QLLGLGAWRWKPAVTRLQPVLARNRAGSLEEGPCLPGLLDSTACDERELSAQGSGVAAMVRGHDDGAILGELLEKGNNPFALLLVGDFRGRLVDQDHR